MDQQQGNQGKVCACPHHKMPAIFVIVFGAVFLLQAFNVLGASTVGVVWPIVVIAAGLSKLNQGKCKCC